MSSRKIARPALRSSAVRPCSSCTFRGAARIGAALSFFAPACTPARWVAERLGRHWSPAIGSGGAVAAATDLQPRCNRHHLEIIGQSDAVARLQQNASRHAHARTCVDARAYARVKSCNLATLSLYRGNTYSYWLRHGCRSVAAATGLFALPIAGRCSNKIGGGNACPPSIVSEGSDLPLKAGAVPRKFWARGARAGRSAGLDLVGSGEAGNGGFLRVCGGVLGGVGMASSEWIAERRRNALFLPSTHKLSKLAAGLYRAGRTAGGVASRRRGGTPPKPATPETCPLPHAVFRIWIDLRPRQCACPERVRGARQGLGWKTGPGVACPPANGLESAKKQASGVGHRVGDSGSPSIGKEELTTLGGGQTHVN